MTPNPPLLDLDDAVATLVRGAGAQPSESCRVEADDAAGRVLATDITADRDLPPFDRATMDGIAIRATDARVDSTIPIVGELAAGGIPGSPPPPGAAIRIATGAALPEGLDAVIAKEDLEELGNETGTSVRIRVDDVRPGRSVHRRGVDARAGDRLVAAGHRVDSMVVAVAATAGLTDLEVRRRPRIAVVTTGDELRPVAARLDRPEDAALIRNGNAPMLAALVRSMGAVPGAVVHVGDDLDATVKILGSLLEESDLVLSVGGVSAGDRDFVPRAAALLELEAGGRGVRVQPGRPFSWWNRRERTRLIGLPGNPVSAFVCMQLFVRPWIDAALGLDPRPRWRPRRLDREISPNPHRTACRPARFGVDRDGRGTARVADWNGSGDLAHLIGTQGLVRLPSGRSPLPIGTMVDTLDWSRVPEDHGIDS